MEEDFNMTISRSKTKIVGRSRHRAGRIELTLKNEIIQEVTEFSYVGSKITCDVKRCREIVSRINRAKGAFNENTNLFT